MALFAGLILELQMTDQVGWQELFPSKKYMATKPVPFAFVAGSSEVLQFLGVGNATQTFTVIATDDTTHLQLEAQWQRQQLATLDLTKEFGPGFSYSNVVLSDVGKKKRLPWLPFWLIDIQFTQFT